MTDTHHKETKNMDLVTLTIIPEHWSWFTQGHTKKLNLYRVGHHFLLVDMPGYGHNMPRNFQLSVESYISSSRRSQSASHFLFYDNYSSCRSQSASHFYFTNKQSENQSAVILLMIIMLLKQSETERGPERLCRINKEGLERCHTNTNQRPELSTVTHLACE